MRDIERGPVALLCINNVSFSYPAQDAQMLKNVNLTIEDGECILLCGRSGCGKTTLTRLLNGLIPHFHSGNLSGEVKIDGENIADIPMHRLAERIGSVFQNPRTQFFNIDTDNEIAFGIENRALPIEELQRRVESTITDLNIQNLRGRNIFELSGGEKQKIAFASIYAMNPDIYLLDEPSSNLDTHSINELREHLQLIKKQGKTIIVAEHRLYYLLDLADRVVYMQDGRIEKIFTSNELRNLPPEQCAKLGLRAVDLSLVQPTARNTENTQPALELKDVSLYHKKKCILEHINVKANSGDIIGIVGCNGAGKTTFSRALCGLHKKLTGEFLWSSMTSSHKAQLGRSYMVMQDVNYQLFAEDVEKECSFGIKNPDNALIGETMKKLGLYEYRNRHPNTLSGGQKQRTAVAVSMICKKDVLVFDEPTSGLDFNSMRQVAELIANLSAMGKIVFVVTHDYEFICQICTKILHFDNGHLLRDFAITEDSSKYLLELFEVNANGK